MIIARLSTAKTILFGPILDANDAEYTSAVVGDVKISKNNGTPSALNGSATLTHKEVSLYELALTAGDLSEVGSLTISLSKTTYFAAPIRIQVLTAEAYDTIFGDSADPAADVVTALGTGSTLTALAMAANLATLDTLLDRIAPLLLGNVTGAGTGTEVYSYGGVTATVTVDVDGNVSNVVFS